MTNKLFTQEVKDNWLKALKSGEYKQGRGILHNTTDNSHCCMGVLELCTPGLGADSAYDFLLVNGIDVQDLWRINDDKKVWHDPKYPRDYSNVISTIEDLPVTKDNSEDKLLKEKSKI